MQTTKSGPPHKPFNEVRPDLINRIWRRMGFIHKPVIKLYPGYGQAEHIIIYGHALSLSPKPRKKYSKFFLLNLLALVRLFIIQPVKGASIQLNWKDTLINTSSDYDGFIKFNWKPETAPDFGWHQITAQLIDTNDNITATAFGSVLIPHSTQFGFISDIDDTFLISHSANLRKRLSVLFTRNAHTRKPFEGVVKHYQLLAKAHTKEDEPNPFFYVSSSEWNLYDYIAEFIRVNGLPKGVLLLSSMKKFGQLLSSGQKSHGNKFFRIVRIMEAFPNQKFVLLGDSSQQDPVIYKSIVAHFPGRIHAVYIRDIYKKKSQSVQQILLTLEETGIPCCFFTHSAEAILHSRKIGLI